ncbi:MAG: response regulator [Deltaproteobacteria bacterium]|nr:response regulator [Deltaproteobacteria bacterium]
MHTGAAVIDQIRIMLVDDDDGVREALGEILTRKGWKVAEFGNAEDAIAALRRSQDYDVVLADINMPGMTGMDLLAKAKESAPFIPVVMITGYPSIDLAVEAMKDGAVDFLPKPFKAEELEVIVRKASEEAKMLRANAEAATAGQATPHVSSNTPEVAKRRLEDKIKELSILHTISETLDEVNEKEDIYRKTMDIAQIVVDSTSAFIMTSEPESGEFVVHAASGFKDGAALIGTRFPAAGEPFRSIVRNKCYSYLMPEGSELSPLVSDGVRASGRRPLLIAPLTINREVVVLLGINGKEAGREVTSDAITLLQNLTAKASLKLENIALSENIFSSIVGAINSLINALDARDTYTKDHSHRVTQYALKIARAYNCQQEILDSISFAGPLHDIGKIGVRDEILLKRSGFTINEREIMRSHVLRGEEILRPLNLMSTEKAVVLYHHERWDGAGYPAGLHGENIPLVARIFSIADTYDAMTSTRPYRTALTPQTAQEEIVRCKGTQFDPELVDAFVMSDIAHGGRH